MRDVKNLGQVFTPTNVVSEMLNLKKNDGKSLEPSCGNGAFIHHLDKNAIGIEIDRKFKGENILNIDFFAYDTNKKFNTIIGNPPYVRFTDIKEKTKRLLAFKLFDKRTNLYLFFIEKCIKHLEERGELIFITPRDFLKATSGIKLNEFIYSNGTITDMIDLGDKRIFSDFTPNCIIWRFEKGNFKRKTNIQMKFLLSNGQLLFTKNDYPLKFSDLFFVKVGAVSGADKIFANEQYGNHDFVCSYTNKTGKAKRMIYNVRSAFLKKHKKILMKRSIRKFTESNWWEWGRKHYNSKAKRIYVNAKTRNKNPFFLHKSTYYDGSVLAIFVKDQTLNVEEIKDELNKINWEELGFVCDGRFLFNQKSLENTLLPENFLKYLRAPRHSRLSSSTLETFLKGISKKVA